MRIEIKRNGQEILFGLVGRLDANTAPVLDKAIQDITSDIQSLIFDLENLEYISSAGLRMLLTAQKKMRGGGMKLRNVSSEVMEIFELTGFADILAIE